jgi:hypothetical protein
MVADWCSTAIDIAASYDAFPAAGSREIITSGAERRERRHDHPILANVGRAGGDDHDQGGSGCPGHSVELVHESEEVGCGVVDGQRWIGQVTLRCCRQAYA